MERYTRTVTDVLDGTRFVVDEPLAGLTIVSLSDVTTPAKGKPGHAKAKNQLAAMIESATVELLPIEIGEELTALVWRRGLFINKRMQERGWK